MFSADQRKASANVLRSRISYLKDLFDLDSVNETHKAHIICFLDRLRAMADEIENYKAPRRYVFGDLVLYQGQKALIGDRTLQGNYYILVENCSHTKFASPDEIQPFIES
jgi:hypothetical protein